MSSPPPTGQATPDPRQRHPTTNHGPAATRTRGYQPDRASRTAPPDRHPPSRPHHSTHRAPTRHNELLTLTNNSPYQLSAGSPLRRADRGPRKRGAILVVGQHQ